MLYACNIAYMYTPGRADDGSLYLEMGMNTGREKEREREREYVWSLRDFSAL